MKKIFDIVKLLLGFPLSILALFFIVKIIFPHKEVIAQNITYVDPQLLVYGILCFLCYFLLRAYVWQQIIKEKGVDLPLQEAAYIWSSSEIKRFIPGNVWSFLDRARHLSEKNIPKSVIFSTFIIEAEFLVLSSIAVSLLAVSFISYTLIPKGFLPAQLIVVLSLTIVSFLTTFFITHTFFKGKIKQIAFLWKILPNFSTTTMSTFFLYSCGYTLFFSLGHYFIIASITYLYPVHFLTFIGFFSFSFIVGYLSILTPMGLGVREGIITIGLAKFISFSLAGFASIYARIILIIVELLFLGFSLIKVKTKQAEAFILFLQNHKYKFFLVLAVCIYTIYFTTASFLRHENFYTGRFDLGNMDQTVWNTLHGRLFTLTDPDSVNIVSRLAYHADFFLVLLTPLYLIWADPRMLLFSQTIALASGAFFIFAIAKLILKDEKLSFIFSLAYLLNPAVGWTNLYDFHAVTFATTFLLAAFYLFLKRNYFLFLIFAFLAGLTKEHVWLIISFFGLFMFLFNTYAFFFTKHENNTLYTKRIIKQQIGGIILFLFTTLLFYFLISYAIPNAKGANHFALSYYADFGDSPTTIIKNILLSPQKLLAIFSQDGRIEYLKQLFLPLGFVSLFSPLVLLFTLPDLLINLLSSNTQLHQIYFQYSAAITPFIFIAAIFGIKDIHKFFPRVSVSLLAYYIFIATIYSAYSFGPLPGAKNPNLDMFTKPRANKEFIMNFLQRLPEKYSVAATNNLGAHLSHRSKIYTIPVGINNADIVAFLHGDQFAQPSPQAQKEMVGILKRDKTYNMLVEKDDFIVFKKTIKLMY